MTKARRPSLKEKVAVYEELLHTIQLHAQVTMDEERVKNLIGRICTWSYAHRTGNGEYSEEQRNAGIDDAFWKLDAYKRIPRKEA